MYRLYIKNVKLLWEVKYIKYNKSKGCDKMLILAKSILGLMLGFFIAVILGFFLIPLLRKLKCKQSISSFTAFRHASKNGTPTLGGLIFIIPTLITM